MTIYPMAFDLSQMKVWKGQLEAGKGEVGSI